MNLIMRALSLVFVAGTLSTQATAADGSSTVICYARYTWAQNSKGQNPCRVIASLAASQSCLNTDVTIEPLSSGSQYFNVPAPPACLCNDVTYSLYSACADCQNATFPDWKSWTAGCNSTSFLYSGVVPAETEVPSWAELDVQSKGIYDPAAAKRFALSAASSSSAEAASSILSAASDAGDSISSFLSSYLSSLHEASRTATTTSVPSVSGSAVSGSPGHGVTTPFPTPTAGESGDDSGGDVSFNSASKSTSSTAKIVGVVIGSLVLVGAATTVLRRLSQQRSPPPRQTESSRNAPGMSDLQSGANMGGTTYRSPYGWTSNQAPILPVLQSTTRVAPREMEPAMLLN